MSFALKEWIACAGFAFGGLIIATFSGCASTDRPPTEAVANEIELRESYIWDPFSPYLQNVMNTIQEEWYRLLSESRVTPLAGSEVTLHLTLNARGEMDVIKVEERDAGRQGVWLCTTAIQARQPYPTWTEEMMAALGSEQTLVFSFRYQ